ncbi:MAG: hypothetical protein ACREJ2_09890 [Planctomycetota bacterium]
MLMTGISETDMYLWIAILGTVLFVAKFLLLLMGGHASLPHSVEIPAHLEVGQLGHGGGGGAGGGGGTAHQSSTGNFTLFSIQGLLAFFMGFGWMGLAALEQMKLGSGLALVLAAGFGCFMMLLSAVLMYMLQRLDREIPFDVTTAVGTIGQVYLRIPAQGGGVGEVQLVVEGRQKVLKAKSTGGELQSFTRVRVVAVDTDETLTVESV